MSAEQESGRGPGERVATESVGAGEGYRGGGGHNVEHGGRSDVEAREAKDTGPAEPRDTRSMWVLPRKCSRCCWWLRV
jgi:hypothetical protein